MQAYVIHCTLFRSILLITYNVTTSMEDNLGSTGIFLHILSDLIVIHFCLHGHFLCVYFLLQTEIMLLHFTI